MVYINADIVLTPAFMRAVRTVAEHVDKHPYVPILSPPSNSEGSETTAPQDASAHSTIPARARSVRMSILLSRFCRMCGIHSQVCVFVFVSQDQPLSRNFFMLGRRTNLSVDFDIVFDDDASSGQDWAQRLQDLVVVSCTRNMELSQCLSGGRRSHCVRVCVCVRRMVCWMTEGG